MVPSSVALADLVDGMNLVHGSNIFNMVEVLQAYLNQGTEHLKLRALIEKIQARPQREPKEQWLPRRFPHLETDQVKAIVADYQAGVQVKELATKYCISRETISKHLRRQAIAPRKVGLDEQPTKEAVRFYEQGDSLATIGKRMGVTAHTVRSRLVEAGEEMRSSYEHLLQGPGNS